MTIDELEAVRLGDSEQWIRIRGRDFANPVLLLIQQGPGLPMINEARRFERVLGLEQDFTVVYWDQRGCGWSLRGQTTAALSLNAMVVDTVSLLEYLRERFGTKVLVAGFSLGATIGALAAAQRPDLVATLVAVGMDIDGPAAETRAYDFALATAHERGHKRAVRQLEKIGPPPHLRAEQFTTRVRWASDFGRVNLSANYGTLVRGLLASLLGSRDYSMADVVRTVRGIAQTQKALLPELARIDLASMLTCIEVPVVMVQGRHDQVAPPAAAQRYVDLLEAPSKQLVWFQKSAHMPHLEEPAVFAKLLTQVQASLLPAP